MPVLRQFVDYGRRTDLMVENQNFYRVDVTNVRSPFIPQLQFNGPSNQESMPVMVHCRRAEFCPVKAILYERSPTAELWTRVTSHFDEIRSAWAAIGIVV